MCIAPAIGKTLYILALPFFNHFGADPAIAAGMFFGIDMGGYALTESMTGDIRIILLGGVLLGSTLGTTVVFTMPVMLTICSPEDQKSLSRGIVIGIISIPFGVTLAGAYPLLHLLIRLLAPALKKLGTLLRINSSAVTAMLASLANPFPFFDMVPAMDSHGKVIATAFMVTAMASFGDHLGFLSVTFPEAIPAMIVTKLVCALSGLLLAECFEYGFHNFRNAVKE